MNLFPEVDQNFSVPPSTLPFDFKMGFPESVYASVHGISQMIFQEVFLEEIQSILTRSKL